MTENKRTVTRRDLIRASGVAGTAGVVGGGALGYLVGDNSADEPSQAAHGSASGEPLVAIAAVDRTAVFQQSSQDLINGAQMAVDEINKRGGIQGRPVEIKAFDIGSALDPAQVRAAFTRIVAQRPALIFAVGVIPPGPDCELAADAGVLYIHFSTQSGWVELYKTDPKRFSSVFMADPPEDVYGTGFATFLADLVDSGAYKPREQTVAIVAGDDPYGQGIAKAFEAKAQELGWKVTDRATTTIGQTVDWGPVLAPIRSNPPALVFCTNSGPQDNISMVRQWVRSPLPSLLYQQFAPSTAEYRKATGEDADGVLWATVLGIQSDDLGLSFRERYQKRYGEDAGWGYSGGGYDALRLWAQAAAQSSDPGDAEEVAPLVEQVIHRGVTGGMSFPKDHTVPAYPSQANDPSLGQGHFIAQIKGGESRQIYPEPFAVAEFELPPWMS